jgi:hypothetical protein
VERSAGGGEGVKRRRGRGKMATAGAAVSSTSRRLVRGWRGSIVGIFTKREVFFQALLKVP